MSRARQTRIENVLTIAGTFLAITSWIAFAFGYGFLGVGLFYAGLATFLLGGDYLDYMKENNG